MVNRNNHTVWVASIIVIFTIIYGLISFVNHYLYRTYALDLGMFSQAIRNVAFFQKPVFTLNPNGQEMPFLATHFSPLVFIFAPLYHIFGNYTLLIVQVAAIAIGGSGVFQYSRFRLGNNLVTPILMLIHFFSIWGIYSALTYDFHCNVLGAMVVPWFFVFYEKKQYKKALFLLVLALLAIETMAIWFAFIIAGLAFSNYDRKKFLRVDFPLIVLCIIAGSATIFVVMPWLQNSVSNLQFHRYMWLGSTPFEVFVNLINSPENLFKILFINTLGDSAYNYIKLEFHIMVLLSGGVFLLFKPRFLFMLIPIYLQKLVPNDYNFWGINNQYSIEFAPLLSIAAISVIAGIKPNYRLPLAIAITSLTIGATAYTMENRVSKWYDGVNTRFYSKQHYRAEFDIKKINRAIRVTYRSKAVSASSRLAPHLQSQKIYHYPIVKDADYVLVLPRSNTWPLSKNDFQHSLDTLRQSQKFSMIYSDNDLLIFKRK